ncbi:hypothetical protein NDU88_004224 [Pleurodeles waltl]|uniref:Uncharacterized protein n=1 Tax=Pleurodeles waltl TaxID=8319 RepID=A0AAV7L0U9_PLEWA|nr:hypothetical protein NDU88_004224 [Pleurodeles waltl]
MRGNTMARRGGAQAAGNEYRPDRGAQTRPLVLMGIQQPHPPGPRAQGLTVGPLCRSTPAPRAHILDCPQLRRRHTSEQVYAAFNRVSKHSSPTLGTPRQLPPTSARTGAAISNHGGRVSALFSS